MRLTRKWFMVLALIWASFACGNAAVACPNCKEAVAAQPKESGRVAGGYNWSILFMIAVPFTMLGTGVFLVRRAAANGAFPEL